MMPEELLSGARSVVAFFVPFHTSVVRAHSRHRETVARQWALAYAETNQLLRRITDHLIKLLAERGIGAVAEPPTENFDPVTLVGRWSHKSVAVIAGLDSFGLHQMVITDAGCAGRGGSLVTDAQLPGAATGLRERCLEASTSLGHLGPAEVCGKCAVGPCAFQSPV